MTVQVLDITRTFVDKLMAIKRHAISKTIISKTRHIYDVVKLYEHTEIIAFLENKKQFKDIIRLTKDTDLTYLEKRNLRAAYNPKESYDFDAWRHELDIEVKKTYEFLHEELLYTSEKQSFDLALKILEKINREILSIDE